MSGAVFQDLCRLWHARGQEDEYVGTLVNAWLAQGGQAIGVPAGESYVDVGTVRGYREAVALLGEERFAAPPAPGQEATAQWSVGPSHS
jgi:hypothetical protein